MYVWKMVIYLCRTLEIQWTMIRHSETKSAEIRDTKLKHSEAQVKVPESDPK